MGEQQEQGTSEVEAKEDFHSCPVFRFDFPPQRICHFSHQFRNPSKPNNFMKGVKWSPDGSCFLTSSEDNSLRILELPDNVYGSDMNVSSSVSDGVADPYISNLNINEAESVYDYCWYPYMLTSDPATCVFASTTRDHPIHLWDAISGQLRCSYRAYDAMDEITAAFSVAFNTTGTRLFGGYNKCLRIFDLHRPGRDFEQHSTAQGIISSISFSPTYNKMFATGSYSQTTAIYAEDSMELLYLLHGQAGGVTQVLFTKDGNYLYTGGRKDPFIMCWDVRNTVDIIYKLYRTTENTNQRILFDIEPCGRHLGTGGQDGQVHLYDLQTGQWVQSFQAASDTVNALCFHPSFPMAATSSGHRRFEMDEYHDEKRTLTDDENCVSLWSFPWSFSHYPANDDESFGVQAESTLDDHSNI